VGVKGRSPLKLKAFVHFYTKEGPEVKDLNETIQLSPTTKTTMISFRLFAITTNEVDRTRSQTKSQTLITMSYIERFVGFLLCLSRE